MATTTRKFGTDISNIQRNFQPKKILSKGGDNTSVETTTKIPIHQDTPQVSTVLETVLPTPSLIPSNESKDQVLSSEKIGSDSPSPVVYSREFLMAFQKICNEPIEGLIPEVLPGYVDPNKVEEDESQAFSPKFSPSESPFQRTVRARSRFSSPLAFTPHNAKSVPAVSNDEQVPSFAREMDLSSPAPQETSPTTTPVTKRAKQTRTPAGEKSNSDMALTPNALKAEWKKKKEKPKESDPKRLRARQKQIDIGMNTVGYARYLELVAPENRTLRIPDIHQVCSKRSWDGQVRKWRRELHKYDPPGSQTNDADDIMSESDGEYDSEDSSDSCSSVIITLNSPSTVK